MKVLVHHIYEYKKGLRNLVLHTLDKSFHDEAVRKLDKNNIDFIVRFLDGPGINIFFGARECVEVIKNFGDKKLSEFTPEEDFILGTMLGYSRLEQCKRYLNMKSREHGTLSRLIG